MKVIKTNFPEVLLITPDIYKDDRGYFFESFNSDKYKKYIDNINFVQDNESQSSFGVLRGLHFQKSPYQQSKLIRVVKGKIQDVVVDIRKESKTFGKYISVELSENNKNQLLIPKGFAHGFLVLSKLATVLYKVDKSYNPISESGYRYDDPAFNIKWMLDKKDVILSDKDKKLPFIK